MSAAPENAAEQAPGNPTQVTSETVMEALKRVTDPEIHQSIVGLGLIYGVIIDDGGKKVTVKMTLTTPYCPYAPQMVEQTRMAAGSVPGVEAVEVELVWDPPWDPRTMASDEVKDILGLW